MSTFPTIDDLEPRQRLLVRIDVNAPVEDGVVRDDRRFERHAETIRELIDGEHAITLLAHQGRPGRETFVSLDQHADILATHLDSDVEFVPDILGEDALSAIDALDFGDVLLLENVRMCEGELPEANPATKVETEFVQTLASKFDAYVNDAYSAAHRSHASIVGFPLVLDGYGGRVMEQEYTANTAVMERTFDGTVTMILGGTKAEDTIPVIDRLTDTVDRFCLGGIIGELFLRADGYDVGFDVDGTEFFDHQWDDHHDSIINLLNAHRDSLYLPSDLAYENDDGRRAEIAVEAMRKDAAYLDVGSDTARRYAELAAESEAVYVKGALGVFEDDRFADGTVEVLSAIADADCFSVVGGGDTAHALELYDIDEDDFTRVSIAGGAYVRALTGESLVGIEVLER